MSGNSSDLGTMSAPSDAQCAKILANVSKHITLNEDEDVYKRQIFQPWTPCATK